MERLRGGIRQALLRQYISTKVDSPVADQLRPYQFYAMTLSLCSVCGERIPAKIVQQHGAMYLLKLCPQHGEHRELLEEDAAYYLNRLQYDKPGECAAAQTKTAAGCPYDCGLCPDHEQHTCIGLLEVTQACDLHCPVCFAHAGDGQPLALDTIARMLDAYQESEGGKAEILQISGGEPTTHPQILEIIRLAKARHIGFVMLNTNGLRLADDEAFVAALSELCPGFEIYLQFDGFQPATYEQLRGRDLTAIKARAIANLTKHNVPVTLVATVAKGINDQEVGHIIQYGLDTPGIRGVNFQPIAYFGRHPQPLPHDRVTLTGVLRRIEQQTHGMIRLADFIPLPCDVDRVAVTYLYRAQNGFVPITRTAKVRDYLPLIDNTLFFDARDILKKTAEGLCSGQVCNCLSFLKDFLPFAPVGKNLSLKQGKLTYAIDNTFRITVTSFLDRYNFEMRAMKKECVHVLTPDLRKIPFSAYNILYREGVAIHD